MDQATTTAPDQLFGYDVFDNADNKIGSVDSVWVDDATNELEFVGVKTGWLFGKTHIIPTASAQLGEGRITVPYPESQIKDAPSFPTDHELSPTEENDVYQYYGAERSMSDSPTGLGDNTGGTFATDTAATSSTATGGTDTYTTDATDTYAAGSAYDTETTGSTYDTESTTDTGYRTESTTDTQPEMTLAEENLQVGTRQVEAGRVRLRKVVRTEHEEVPVELQREQVSIERVDAADTDVPTNAFQEEEVEVPVMQEEPVVSKETVATGGVRLNKDVQTDTQTVGADVRREDVEVDRDVDTDGPTQTRTY